MPPLEQIPNQMPIMLLGVDPGRTGAAIIALLPDTALHRDWCHCNQCRYLCRAIPKCGGGAAGDAFSLSLSLVGDYGAAADIAHCVGHCGGLTVRCEATPRTKLCCDGLHAM